MRDLPIGYQAKATMEDGWIYGLGISNMKCAFAGFWSALQMMRDGQVDLSGEVIVAGVAGEIEKAPVDVWQGKRYRGGGSGARFMLNHGVTANYCINGEPTGLRLQTGNAGYLFVRIHIKGDPQSTFSREHGVDPLPKAFRVHSALGDWEKVYQERHPHPYMKPLVGVGAIFGGYPYKPSLTPGFCNLYLHVNMVPGQSIAGVKEELEELLRSLAEEDPELDASVDIYLASNGHEIDIEHAVPQAVGNAHRRVFDTEVTRPNPGALLDLLGQLPASRVRDPRGHLRSRGHQSFGGVLDVRAGPRRGRQDRQPGSMRPRLRRCRRRATGSSWIGRGDGRISDPPMSRPYSCTTAASALTSPTDRPSGRVWRPQLGHV